MEATKTVTIPIEEYERLIRTQKPVLEGITRLESNLPDCCKKCSNAIHNGGSGICNCSLPYMTTTTYIIK